jgi:hypothetical protein
LTAKPSRIAERWGMHTGGTTVRRCAAGRVHGRRIAVCCLFVLCCCLSNLGWTNHGGGRWGGVAAISLLVEPRTLLVGH